MFKFIKKLIRWFRSLPPEYSQKELGQLSLFGSWNSPSGPRLIMQKQASGLWVCKKCKGFGTYGNPLCGALYRCSDCKGYGK